MKLTALTLLKQMGVDSEPILLGMACELSSFNYFQRGTAKETIRFFSRTVAKRTPEGSDNRVCRCAISNALTRSDRIESAKVVMMVAVGRREAQHRNRVVHLSRV